MAQKVEHCENCGRIIRKLEQAYVYQSKILCAECNNRLRGVTSVLSQDQAEKKAYNMSTKKLLGIIGVIVLFLILAVGSVDDSGESGGSSPTQWFQGGNLHRATGAQWRNASYQNKLATAADWLSVTKWKGHLASPDDFDRLKLKAQMLVNAVDETIVGQEADYLKVAEIAAMLINMSNDLNP